MRIEINLSSAELENLMKVKDAIRGGKDLTYAAFCERILVDRLEVLRIMVDRGEELPEIL